MRAKRAQVPLIQPPQFSALAPVDAEQVVVLASHELYSQQLWENQCLDASEVEELAFEQLRIQQGSFQHAQLRLLQSIDCRYQGCDFAACTLEKAYIRRNEFLDCRMLGLKLMDADLQDVVFSHCNTQLIRFWTSSFKAVRFEHCNFREASFDGSDLSGVTFYKCDLSQADFRNTNLKGTDLRGSAIQGIQIRGKDLAGVVIDQSQAFELIQLFGVIVRAEQI